MFDTLCAILETKDPQTKAVIWTRDCHIADTRPIPCAMS
jgi:erythromycin esterase-like protein